MNAPLRWETSVQFVKGIGPMKAALFKKIGVETVEDLLLYLPYRYEDRTRMKKVSELVPNEQQTFSGEVREFRNRMTPRRRVKIFELVVGDETGVVVCKWFNQPYLEKVFKTGQKVVLTGKPARNPYERFQVEFSPVSYEILSGEDDDLIHHGRIVPVYHETQGLTSRMIRKLMKTLLEEERLFSGESLPTELLSRHSFPPLPEALREVHFPSNRDAFIALPEDGGPFRKRLVFEDFFFLEIGLLTKKTGEAGQTVGISFRPGGGLEKKMMESLPFSLTSAQRRVLDEIQRDMAAPRPMSRLLQGDVGSGKTILALLAMLMAFENGYQACLMAPTEILAEQHYFNMKNLLQPLGIEPLLLTSGTVRHEQEETLRKISEGSAGLIIGTHSLVQEHVQFGNLGLAVVDEQHRFGVRQRMELKKKGASPDMLIMTATPIPRTLALTLYGDLDLSVLDELPPGRRPIETRISYAKQRAALYSRVEAELRQGRQAYVVYPLIEESEKVDLAAAVTMFRELQDKVFSAWTVGLLHGRMKREERENVMARFKKGEIHILVATTVIEVGVDVSNASMMVIEHAERFGLAQLHQLRGRVGRGQYQSCCFLAAEYPMSEEAKRRLSAMVRTGDGFKLAEEDLAIRGPGEFFGTRQSGIPELRVASLLKDGPVLEIARREAMALLKSDPLLSRPEHRILKEVLARRWRDRLDIVTTG